MLSKLSSISLCAPLRLERCHGRHYRARGCTTLTEGNYGQDNKDISVLGR